MLSVHNIVHCVNNVNFYVYFGPYDVNTNFGLFVFVFSLFIRIQNNIFEKFDFFFTSRDVKALKHLNNIVTEIDLQRYSVNSAFKI